jgi:hypothetical protein
LTLDEIWPLLNILNEVCHGIRIGNFEEIIGVKKEDVVNLMDKISKEENKEVSILILNDLELNALKRSFREVFNQIDEWEFQTRIGISRQEANIIKKS